MGLDCVQIGKFRRIPARLGPGFKRFSPIHFPIDSRPLNGLSKFHRNGPPTTYGTHLERGPVPSGNDAGRSGPESPGGHSGALNGGFQEKMRPSSPPPTCVRPGAGGLGGVGEGGHSRRRMGLWAASQPHPGPRAPPPARGGPPATLKSAETAEPRAESCEAGWEGPDESGRGPVPIEAASQAVPQPQPPPLSEPMAKIER